MYFYIITNMEKDIGFEFTKKVCEYIKGKGQECSYQLPLDDTLQYNSADIKRVPKETDVIIVMGGDGTLIQAARDLSRLSIPILSVNIGHMGYLTEIDKEQVYSAIDETILGNYSIDKRMVLSGTIIKENEEFSKNIALNDIVLGRTGPMKIIDFDVYVNGEYLISYRADGLIIATPTGSTAYNLSAGGPIISPFSRMIVMTPICPHTLSKSSVVFSGDDELTIVMTKSRNGVESRAVTFDGDEDYELKTGDKIIIQKSELEAKFIRIRKQNFLQILRNKL